MKVNKKQAEFLKDTILQWKNEGLLTESLAADLTADLQITSFDWRRLAKYSFWISIICILTAVSSVLADRILIEWIEKFFNAPYEVKMIFFALIATGFFMLGMKRKNQFPEKFYSNEAIFFLGVLSTAGTVYQFGRVMDSGTGHFSLLLLISFAIYALLGWLLKSNLIWIFALVSLGGWMGTETGYMSGWGAYYLGMNYPLRFVIFGGALLTGALFLEKNKKFNFLFRSTLAMGLSYFFIALWLLSIFGNYGDMNSWSRVKQYELFHWAFLFGLAALGAIIHGLKFENGMTKGFGITFLFINLYTRFFEYFWESFHKAIFFAILGISFWILGSKAEIIWRIGERKK